MTHLKLTKVLLSFGVLVLSASFLNGPALNTAHADVGNNGQYCTPDFTGLGTWSTDGSQQDPPPATHTYTCYEGFLGNGGTNVISGTVDTSITITALILGQQTYDECYGVIPDASGEGYDYSLNAYLSEDYQRQATTVSATDPMGGALVPVVTLDVGDTGTPAQRIAGGGDLGTCNASGWESYTNAYQYPYIYDATVTINTTSYANGTYVMHFLDPAPVSGGGNTDTSNYQFTVQHPGAGTINVAVTPTTRPANWTVTSSAAQYTGSGTGATYTNSPASLYLMTDQSFKTPYGFNPNTTFTMRPSSRLFAYIVKSADASNCTGWQCQLTAAGSVTYNIQSTFCSIHVNSTLNGSANTGVTSTITEANNPTTGDPNASNSPNSASVTTTTGGTATTSLITDPNTPQSFTLNAPSTITVAGVTSDLNTATMVKSAFCPVNGGNNQSITLTEPYISRAILRVQ